MPEEQEPTPNIRDYDPGQADPESENPLQSTPAPESTEDATNSGFEIVQPTEVTPETNFGAMSPEQRLAPFYARMLNESQAEQVNFAQASTEPAALARAMTSARANEVDFDLNDYFGNLQRSGLCTFQPSESLASQIETLEQGLIAQFELQLPHTINLDQKHQALNAIRETLYTFVMTNKLPVEKISSLLSGGIRFLDQPGDEIKGKRYDGTIIAYYQIENGIATMYFYSAFLAEPEEEQSLVAMHEVAHIISKNFWPLDIQKKFSEAAYNPTDEAVAELAKYPELQHILKVLQNPNENAGFFRPYVADRLHNIGRVPEEQKGQERIIAANEIIADMVAFYLKDGDRPEGYVSSRMQHQDNNKIISLVVEKLGCRNLGEMYHKLGIDPNNTTPSELIAILSREKRLDGMFASSSDWLERLNKIFEENGKNISGTLDKSIQISGCETANSEGGGSGGISGSEKDPFTWFWEIMTGVKDTDKHNLF